MNPTINTSFVPSSWMTAGISPLSLAKFISRTFLRDRLT